MKKSKPKIDKLEYLLGNLKYNEVFYNSVEEIRSKWDIESGGFDRFDNFVKWERNLYHIGLKKKTKRDDTQAQLFMADVANLLLSKPEMNPAVDFYFIRFYVMMSERLLKELGLLSKNKLHLNLEYGHFAGGQTELLVVRDLSPLTAKEDWVALWPKVEKMKEFMFAKKWPDMAKRFRVMHDKTNEPIAKFIIEEQRKNNELTDEDIRKKINKSGKGLISEVTGVSKIKQRFLHKVKKDTYGNA